MSQLKDLEVDILGTEAEGFNNRNSKFGRFHSSVSFNITFSPQFHDDLRRIAGSRSKG